MTNGTIDQSQATAGADIVGGNKTTNIYSPDRPSPIATLLKRLEQERKSDAKFDRIIDELQHFCDSVDSEELVGLATKLERGDRAGLIPVATKEKELFAKRLAEHQHWRSAQDIYAFMLGRVRDRFEAVIVPLLAQGACDTETDAAIVRDVIDPCLEELQSNDLGVNTTHLRGMVYFLTGNSFLKWERGPHAPISPGT